MAQLGIVINPEEHEERRGDWEVLPAGRYALQAMEGDIEPNSKGTGQNVWFTFEVIDGELKGRTFRHYINNIVHEKPIPQKIGQEELAEFTHALGKSGLSDTDHFLFQPFFANVKVIPAGTVTKGKNGAADYVQKNAKNEIGKYEHISTGAGQVAPQRQSAPASAPAARVAAPVTQVRQPTPSAPAATVNAGAPWKNARRAA